MKAKAVLALDTSSAQCSLALHREDGKVFDLFGESRSNHNEEISVLTQELLDLAELPVVALGGIVIGSGPGSFTGLRIGYSFALGLSASQRIPVVQVSSFYAAALKHALGYQMVAVVADARRGEYYGGIYTRLSANALKVHQEPRLFKPVELLQALERHQLNTGIGQEQTGLVVLTPGDGFESQYPKDNGEHLALGLLRAEPDLASHSGYWVESLSSLEPEYVRGVFAKTIQQREVDKASRIE